MKDLEDRLAAMETRIALSELRAKYAWYVTRGMNNEYADLFTEDGVFESVIPGGVAIVGRERLRAHFAFLKPGMRVPLISNEVLDIDGDEARGTCAMYSPVSATEGIGLSGHYIDRFSRKEGKWLFSARRFYPYWPAYGASPDTVP